MKSATARYLISACLAAALAALAFTSQATGLAGIKVQSALGQALVAEIEIVALQPKQFDSLQARIAGPEAYKAANLTYAPVLRQLRIAPEQRGEGKAVLKLTSVAPINEPSLEALVEFTWPGGRLVQKYSILLDPQK
jgi:pilus assembly protein FimV